MCCFGENISDMPLQIRKLTASQMYKTLLTYDVLEPEVMEEVLSLLSDTDWWVVCPDAVFRCDADLGVGFVFQGEWPCHSAGVQESALWLVGSAPATAYC